VTTWPKGLVQVGENAWPVLGCDVLHRVDRHHGVESFDEREFLQTDLLEVDGNATALGHCQHVGRLVDADDLMPCHCDEGEIPSRGTWCLEHHPVIRAEREQPLDPGLLWPVWVGVSIVVRRFCVVGGENRRPPLVDPHAPLRGGLSQVVVHRIVSVRRGSPSPFPF
jgi:hypothetical protein